MAPAWAVLSVIAVLAWVVTVRQATGMGVSLGTAGMALPSFLTMWIAMMAAMMFPSVAPVAVGWTLSIHRRSARMARVGGLVSFVAGYLLAWTGYGLVAFGALLGTERVVQAWPAAARWLGVGIFAVAGLYQLTPLKTACLSHCRSPFGQLLRYSGYRGRARDLRVGFHHGAFCVGCCWGLMVVLIAVGVMNVAAMAALAAAIFLEKLWRHGQLLSRLMGVAFLVLAGLAVFLPDVVPALRAEELRMVTMGAMGG